MNSLLMTMIYAHLIVSMMVTVQLYWLADAVRATVVLLDFIAPASNSAPEVVAAGEAAVFLINDMVCERCICMMSSLY
jgi:hypothetical protein